MAVPGLCVFDGLKEEGQKHCVEKLATRDKGLLGVLSPALGG